MQSARHDALNCGFIAHFGEGHELLGITDEERTMSPQLPRTMGLAARAKPARIHSGAESVMVDFRCMGDSFSNEMKPSTMWSEAISSGRTSSIAPGFVSSGPRKSCRRPS